MFRVFRTLIVGATALSVFAQTQIDLRTQSKSIDFSAAGLTKPVRLGAVLPGACSAGELFLLTSASIQTNLYGCSAAGAWTVLGAAPNLNVQNDGAPAGSRGTLNFITGVGLTSIVSDDGSAVNIQSAVDTAVVQTQPGEQSGVALLCASGSGSGSSYQCSLNPTASAYRTGMVVHWIPDVNGSGGPTTLNIDTLGAVRVKAADGATDPGSSEIMAGRLYELWYDGVAFRFVSGSHGAGRSRRQWDCLPNRSRNRLAGNRRRPERSPFVPGQWRCQCLQVRSESADLQLPGRNFLLVSRSQPEQRTLYGRIQFAPGYGH